MRKFTLLFTLTLLFYGAAFSQVRVVEDNNYVVFEAEEPDITGTQWILIDSETASGGKAIEMTGGTINGSASPGRTPIDYKFTLTHAGDYRLIIRCSKRLEGAEHDKCNDGYIKISPASNVQVGEGGTRLQDYTSPKKFFGGTEWPNWGWATQIDDANGVHGAKGAVVYRLEAGVEYTFTLAGRSIRWNVDKILLYDINTYTMDEAKANYNTWQMAACSEIDYNDVGWDLLPDNYNAQGTVDNSLQAVKIEQPSDDWAAATMNFNGTGRAYDVVLTTLLESAGQSEYRVLVNDTIALQFANKVSDGVTIPDNTEYSVGSKGIVINENSEIKVEFKTVTENATDWSSALWRKLYIGSFCEVSDVFWGGDDFDGVADEIDNCPSISNPAQYDYDMDGLGDACDGDIDNDNVLNEVDNCVFAQNEDQSDLDDDGIGDLCDLYPSNPCQSPSSADISNGAEAGQTPYITNNIPGRFQAEHFDIGGNNVAFKETATSNPSIPLIGLIRSDFRESEAPYTLIMTDNSETTNSFVGGISIGEWAEYTLSVVDSGAFGLKIRYAAYGDVKVSFRLNNEQIGCLFTLPSTNGLTIYETVDIQGKFLLKQGDNVFSWVAEDLNLSLDWFEFNEYVPVNININKTDNTLKVYPNPFKNGFTIETKEENIAVYNAFGQEVNATVTPITIGYEIKLEGNCSGVYFVKAGKHVSKVIKE